MVAAGSSGTTTSVGYDGIEGGISRRSCSSRVYPSRCAQDCAVGANSREKSDGDWQGFPSGRSSELSLDSLFPPPGDAALDNSGADNGQVCASLPAEQGPIANPALGSLRLLADEARRGSSGKGQRRHPLASPVRARRLLSVSLSFPPSRPPSLPPCVPIPPAWLCGPHARRALGQRVAPALKRAQDRVRGDGVGNHAAAPSPHLSLRLSSVSFTLRDRLWRRRRRRRVAGVGPARRGC